MCHVFISYVREDIEKVNLIKLFLENYNIKVWIDHNSLSGGDKWKAAIYEAINKGTYFIACFSDNSLNKEISYMNEELILAIEALRLRPYNRKWFIPIRLTNCEIPARPLGAGETLKDIQCIDLYDNFLEGLSKLISIITPKMSPSTNAEIQLSILLKYHIDNKRKFFKANKAICLDMIEDRWCGLLDDYLFEQINEAFYNAFNRMQKFKCVQNERIIENNNEGRIIVISVAPELDYIKIIESLNYENNVTNNKYIDFVINEKRIMRKLPNWQKRDFVHIIFTQLTQEAEIDLLYLLNIELYLNIIHILNPELNNEAELMPIEQIYPTNILDVYKFEMLFNKLIKEDATAYRNKR